MTVVLGVDLSYTGPTGWVMVGSTDVAVLTFGEISPNTKGKAQARKANATYANVLGLIESIEGMVGSYARTASSMGSELVVAYEKTDWHQDVAAEGGGVNKEAYARERNTLRALSYAEAAMCIACAKFGVIPLPVGVSDARSSIGASDKKSAIRVLSMLYPKEFSIDESFGLLKHKNTGVIMSDHQSDALVIATVILSRHDLHVRLDSGSIFDGSDPIRR